MASEEEIKVSLNWLGKQQKTAGHCPRCGKPLDSFERHALSRRANITICDECGLREALEDAGIHGYIAEGCKLEGPCTIIKKDNRFGEETEESLQGLRFSL